MNQWHEFLRERSHVLTGYPELLRQEAGNYHPGSPVTAAARSQRAAGRWSDLLWLERLASAPTRKTVLTLAGHTDAVHAVELTRDEQWIISAGQDATVRIWSHEDGRELHRLEGHLKPIRGMALSSSGRWIVSGGDDLMLLVRDSRTGAEVRMIAGNHRMIRCLACFHARSWVVCGTEDGRVNLFSLEDGEQIATFRGSSAPIDCIAVAPDDHRIVAGGEDGRIRIWDLEAPQDPLVLSHRARILALAISPNGSRLAAADFDDKVVLWDFERGTEVHRWQSRRDPILAVAFGPEGNRLWAGTRSGWLIAWNVDRFAESLRVQAHNGPVNAIAIRGASICTASDSVKVWEADLLLAPSSEAPPEAPIPNQLMNGLDPSRRLHGLGPGKWRIRWGLRGKKLQGLGVAPDGKAAAAALERPENWASEIRIWSTRSGRLLTRLSGHESRVTGLALSNRYLVSVSSGHVVGSTGGPRFEPGWFRVWDLEKRMEPAAFPARYLGFWALALSPDGSRAAVANADGLIELFTIPEAASLATLGVPIVRNRMPGTLYDLVPLTPERARENDALVTALAFTADGQNLIAGTVGGSIALWNLGAARIVARYLAFAPIRRLASEDDLVAAGTDAGPILLRMHGLRCAPG